MNPPGGPITVLFSAKKHKKEAFEEPVKRYSWRDTLTVSLVSLIFRSGIGVSETGSAKMGSAIDVRIDDADADTEFPYRLSLTTHTPLIKGVEVHPLN